MLKLGVPLVYQENSHSCVPACLKMVIDFLRTTTRRTSTDVLPSLNIKQIGRIVGTDLTGTSLEGIKNLNMNRKILKLVPSLEFGCKQLCEFEEIVAEIKSNRPVIAWISASDEKTQFKFTHSVVITGVDAEGQAICYNDPIWGEKEESVADFMRKWEGTDRTLIKIEIGTRAQRLLDEWVHKKREVHRP